MAVTISSRKQREAIGEFFDHCRDTAQQNFERDGCMEPVAILMGDEENAILPLRKIINHKDAASRILNRLIEAAQPLAFVLIVEAWMAAADEQPRDADGELVDLEEKYQRHLTEETPDGDERPKEGVKDVVMLQCSSATGENFMLTADIVRAEGEKPSLKQWVRCETVGAEGRFMFDVTPLVQKQ